MFNFSLSIAALASAISFYCFLDDAMPKPVQEPKVDVWHCDGWAGKMYPTEVSMKRAMK